MLTSKSYKKVVILGIDGMAPEITEYLMKLGKLPNLLKLRENGYYSKLKTVCPAESCVVWTSFATGCYPGEHGIFDFIMRDPQKYLPYLSLNEIVTKPRFLKIANFKIKIGEKFELITRQKKESFWIELSKKKIPVFIYFCPNTFPGQKVYGKMVSGMGVPDLYGVIGRYIFYCEEKLDEGKEIRGKIVPVSSEGNTIRTFIYGPKVKTKDRIEEAKVALEIVLYPEEESAELKLGKTKFFLKEREWSKFYKVTFRIDSFRKVRGIVKFYLKSIKPFELYCSPVNIDPTSPVFPISYPYNYSRELAEKIGLYHTQGMPHDTWAYLEGRLDEKAFLEHADDILTERVKILNEVFKKFKSGFLFFYFDTLDIIQHLFWREMESQNHLYKDIIYDYYVKIDNIIGDVLEKIEDKTIVIVLSDHGFKSFDYAVDLNRWLIEQGYLSIKNGVEESEGFFEHVNWNATKAYALGFGGIYINEIGREKFGIVFKDDTDRIKKEISEKLLEIINPENGQPVIYKVHRKEKIFSGRYENLAPDLYLGFYPGYRISWRTALGGFSKEIIEPNTRAWSGDHLIDPSFVPGVLFSNHDLNLKEPSITDIASLILEMY